MARSYVPWTMVMVMMMQLVLIAMHIGSTSAHLTPTFYSTTCPSVQGIVRSGMTQALQNDSRIGASLLRLFFHDCFVQGCDASVLLDDTSSFVGEKTAFPNANSLRGFDVIDGIKAQVEAACPGVVSCADILALAARDGVALSSGPSWSVPLGRRDSRTASLSAANANLPAPTSTLDQLTAKFQAQGLLVQDMVALSGGHTIGQARCTTFKARLYNQSGSGLPDPKMSVAYQVQLASECPASGGDNNLSPLDVATPTTFDNTYFSNLLHQRGLLSSDQALYSTNGPNPAPLFVSSFASSPPAFFAAFSTAMLKMGNLNPLTGTNGEIRTNCHFVN